MRWPRIATFLLLGALGVAPARAQGAAGFQDIDTSIRAAGMGGATTAVGWGEPGVWGNPATLASVRGIGWLEGHTRLVPDVDPAVRFKTRRFLLGAAGIGVSLMGEPEGLGHTRLEYHEAGGTDPFGNPVVGPAHTDETRGWGIAISPIQLLDAFRAKTTPGSTPLAPGFDVSGGYHHKRTRATLVGDITAEADNFDWGVLTRFGIAAGESDRSTRFEFSAGYAVSNDDEGSHFVFPAFGDQGPSTRIRRTGVAVRALLPFGDLAPDARPWAWPGALPSAVALGLAYDRDERTDPNTGTSNDLDHWGFEGTFMDILAARVGYLDDPAGDVHAVTFGAGLHVPVGPWATIGYDWALQPSPPGAKDVNRHGLSLWLHPDAFWPSRQQGK